MRSITLILVAASVLTLAACSSDGDAADVTFGPQSTPVPARTIPAEAEEFCSLRASTLAVGDLFNQLEEPLQLLVERRYAEAVEPAGQLFDAIDIAIGVLDDIQSTAPDEIAADVALVTDHTLEGFTMLPAREDFLAALQSEDEATVATQLGQFEAGIGFLGETQPDVDAAATRMRDYIAVTC